MKRTSIVQAGFRLLVTMLLILCAISAQAQTWTGLRTQGEQIVDANGNNVILRGFGMGELTNTEAYMLEWPDGNSGQSLWYYGYTRIHDTIASLAGSSVEQQFTSEWEANILTDADMATMQSWGVNSIRLSINYHWLSPANGTYLASGWAKIDRVIALAKAHNIKIILCMHAAPGAQSPELMADTPDGAAHLWTQPTIYQPWTINLWQAIAQRYANEPAVAGYDLLDEPLLSESNSASGGSTVRAFYVSLTNAIRSVDMNHIIFACGTDWCGSVAGVQAILPPWDNNMVLVLHDYDNPIDTSVISGLSSIRSQYNIPIWDGESGESANSWATSLVSTMESNNIGWSWWTFKKVNGSVGTGLGNGGNTTEPYEIPEPANYADVLNYVQNFGSGTPPSSSAASTIFLALAANAATAKCTYNSGLVSSLFGKSPAIFSLSASPSAQTVAAGASTSFTATVAPIRSFKGAVALSVVGLPSGATASFSPASISGGSGTSTLNVSTNTSIAAGTYNLTIVGSSGSLTEEAYVSLTVSGTTNPDFSLSASPASQTVTAGSGTSYTATVAPIAGFSSVVTLSVSGLPSGATASFSPASVSGSGSSTLSISTSSSVAAGSYSLTIIGTSGSLSHSASATLTVNAAAQKDFSISATPASQTITQGGSTSYSTTIVAINGFSSAVTLSVSGLPTGATASFTPTSVSGAGSSTLGISTSSTTPTGTYTLTIAGTSGSLNHSTSVPLVITGILQPDFTLSTSPSSQTVTAGGSTTYTSTIAPVNGFSGTVALSVGGLPSGATGSFSPASVSASGSATLSITTTSSVAAGSYLLTIAGTSGSLTHSATATLVVNSAAGKAIYQVNSGGSAAAPFIADKYYSGGQTASVSTTVSTTGVTNPAPAAVYKTERWGGDSNSNPAPFSYTFSSLTAGTTYTVRLHFAEIYWTSTGQRKFNVAINGTTVLSNFDIVAAAGGANKAIVEQFTTNANSSGKIVVSFTVGSADAPKISGIEIIQ